MADPVVPPIKKPPQPGDPDYTGGQTVTYPFDAPDMGGKPLNPPIQIDKVTPNPIPPPGSPAPPIAPAPQIPASPSVGGSADFPSLPPGATPPPGYFDPVSGKTAPGGAGVAPAAAPAAPGAPAAPAAPADPNAPPATVADAYKKQLIDALNGGNKPPTLDDPTLKAQADAYGVQQTRATEKARSALAERNSVNGSSGVNSGSFNNDLAGMQQAQGENQAGFNAGLLGDAAKQQKEQLLQYMALAGGDLNADQARQLQSKLADLDAQIRREGIAQQGALGQGDLALRGRLGEGQLNLGLLQALLGNSFNNRSLDQQGAQFGAGLDTSTILGLLGGLR